MREVDKYNVQDSSANFLEAALEVALMDLYLRSPILDLNIW